MRKRTFKNCIGYTELDNEKKKRVKTGPNQRYSHLLLNEKESKGIFFTLSVIIIVILKILFSKRDMVCSP